MAQLLVPDWLHKLAAHAETTGLTATLVFICLMQYVVYLYYRYRRTGIESDLLTELDELTLERNVLQQQQYLARMENIVLTDVFAQTEADRVVRQLLKKFLPHSSDGVAIFFARNEEELRVHAERGLSQKSSAKLELEADWVKAVLENNVIEIPARELYQSQFLAEMTPKERRKTKALHLLAVSEGDDVFGIIASSQLFPAGVDQPIQQEFLSKILRTLSRSLRQAIQMQDQRQLLQQTQEKLALRSIADRFHDMPTRLLDDYLKRLTTLVDADRGAMILFSQNEDNPLRFISRQGQKLQIGIEGTWREHELKYARWCRHQAICEAVSTSRPEQMGINSLIGSVLAVPLYQQKQNVTRRLVGIICMTRQARKDFSQSHKHLAEWAAEFLSETLLRVVDRVAVERKANMDGLTELANRRTFDGKLLREIEIANRTGNECSLCLLDIDHFKQTNDTYGHQAGDEVLRQFSRLLEAECRHVRSTDSPLIARYGGEEMAILMPGVGSQGATRIAESIRKSTQNMVVLHNNQRIRVSVSIGISSCPRHSTDATSLVRLADEALYRAKENGRNQVCCSESSITPASVPIQNLEK